MSKFRYYVVHLDLCTVYGTDDEVLAYELSEDDDLLVIDSKGAWLVSGDAERVVEWPQHD